MKKTDLIFSTILLPLDYLMIILAGLTAYALRYEEWVQNIRPVIFNLDFKQYFFYLWIVGLTWLVFFAVAGLYQIKGPKKIASEIGKIVLACSTGMLAVIVLAFFSRELFDSRFILLVGWIFAILFVIVDRLVVRAIQRILYKRGIGVHKIVLIGGRESIKEIYVELLENKKLGYKVVVYLENFSEDKKNELEKICKKIDIDEIILTDINLSKKENLVLLDFAESKHITFKYVADFFATQVARFDISTLAGVPIVEVKNTALDGWGKIFKRIADIFFSFIILVFLIIPFIILAIIIKMDSKGPVFYGSKRIGAKGKKIIIWKFRSMIENAEKMKEKLLDQNERNDGPLFKMKNDPRITQVGKFIRRWSIDELPQFWNVLRGDISLVGPRPHEPREVEQYKKHHKKLLNIKPGMTGMAQISGRSDLSFEEEVKLDILYIEDWSIWLDLIIFLKTPGVVLKKKGAK